MELWVGTSGYSYPDWVGRFYPPGTTAGKMFGHYTRHFPLVELNYTFYRPPTAEGLFNLAARAPDGFEFIVKLHRSLSHEHDLSGASSFRQALSPLEQEDRLLAVLCQYPQRFHRSAQNLDRLAALAERFRNVPFAVEFRHSTWNVPETADWLAERGLHLVSVDVPDIPALFPSGVVQSGRLLYVRLHSHRARSWYGSDKERYDYLYTDEELVRWLRALDARQTAADRALLLFNNCHGSQAAANARRVVELFGELDLSMRLIGPFVSADDGRQGSLF